MIQYNFYSRLLRRFEKQAVFAKKSSPLVAAQCEIYASLLHDEQGWFCRWLLNASGQRQSFEVPLLLMAGLHSAVLASDDRAEYLAEYFLTVGGKKTPVDHSFAAILQETVQSLEDYLHFFLQKASVQTNETGRGICWLLPLSFVSCKQIHLVDLGASAGLNLIAEQRKFAVTDTNPSVKTAQFGKAAATQFALTGTNSPQGLSQSKELPAILTRTGCDIAPFYLNSQRDEIMLASFIWGDQVQRMERLKEGIAAFHHLNTLNKGICLEKVRLPDELQMFLESLAEKIPDSPIVLYNSYLNNYLADKGVSLFHIISKWAAEQDRIIIWIPMDRPQSLQDAPKNGWLLWQAHVWMNSQYTRWDFGWCHPHGSEIKWLPGINQWIKFWQNY